MKRTNELVELVDCTYTHGAVFHAFWETFIVFLFTNIFADFSYALKLNTDHYTNSSLLARTRSFQTQRTHTARKHIHIRCTSTFLLKRGIFFGFLLLLFTFIHLLLLLFYYFFFLRSPKIHTHRQYFIEKSVVAKHAILRLFFLSFLHHQFCSV